MRTSRPRTIALLLAAFFMFKILWGNTLSVGFIIGGYSTFSFIGIYLLAGLLKKTQQRVSSLTALSIFSGCVLLNGILYIATIRLELVAVSLVLCNYINPLVIASAAFLLLTFANCPIIKGGGKLILWFGSSSFAAYLLHVGAAYSASTYFDAIRHIYSGQSWSIGLMLVIVFNVAVFLSAIVLDQPRKLVWKYLLSPLIVKNK